MSHLVVLLSGRQGAGKSTLADALSVTLSVAGYVVERLKFAGALYKMHDAVREVLKKDGMDLKGASEGHYSPFTGIDGPLLQVLGTEWGRKSRGENFWVDYVKQEMLSRLAKNYGDSTIFIIDDCRFPNELSAFPGNSVAIRLDAPEEVRKARAEKWRNNTQHPSETALDGASFDLQLDTGVLGPAACVEAALRLVLSRLKEKENGRK